MGSQAIQGSLWGRHPADWGDIQETTGKPGYHLALSQLAIKPGMQLLDIGCGTGYFCKLASDQGASINGLDATPEFIEAAKKRLPTGEFGVGEMEELPFPDKRFNVVCGFNSFQYAASTKQALTEARRVLADEGKLVAMIWGSRADCEAATYLKAVGSLLPPPPPGAGGPFALSENEALERLMNETGFASIKTTDVDAIWDYPDTDTALRGLMSAGPVARAVDVNGVKKVFDTVSEAVKPYIQSNGRVIYRNKYRVVIADRGGK